MHLNESPVFPAASPMKLFSTIAVVAIVAPLTAGSPSLAQVACTPGGITQYTGYGATGCKVADKVFSNFLFTGFEASSTFSVTALAEQHTFSASGLNFTPGDVASYSYLVTLTDGSFGIQAYRTSATSSEVTLPLVGTKTLTGNPAGITSTAVDTTIGNAVLYPSVESGPVAFTGTINVTGGRMDVFTDSISQALKPEASATPGPLPILGAAAAFGSVRKLRKFSSLIKQG
jgi:hypothetical protein